MDDPDRPLTAFEVALGRRISLDPVNPEDVGVIGPLRLDLTVLADMEPGLAAQAATDFWADLAALSQHVEAVLAAVVGLEFDGYGLTEEQWAEVERRYA